jgi:diguanylate cyclase (GGDEF)-like protein/PAS domain S-box-containing protein
MTQTETALSTQPQPQASDPISAVFDAPHERRLFAEALERALDALIERYPSAVVFTADSTGVFVPVPASIQLREHTVLEGGRTGLDFASDEDAAAVIANWERALAVGASRLVLRHADESELTVYALDVRQQHGVVFALITASAGYERVREQGPSALLRAPRFTTVRKNERATITKVDDAFTQILGWTPQEMVGRRSLELVHPDDHPLAVDNWMQMLVAPGPARRIRQRIKHKDGSWVWFEVTNHNLLDDPQQACVVAEMVDISDEMAAHEALRAREQLLASVAETVPVGLLQIDRDRRIVYTNDRLHEILGVARADTFAEQLATVTEDDLPALELAVQRALEQGQPGDVEAALRLPAGGDRRFCTISLRALDQENGSVGGLIACVADVTDSARMRAELERRATYDELTGCYSRAAIMRALDAHVASGQRRAERAVLFVDLDGFKEVNDQLGHAAGDQVLHAVAQRLQDVVRDEDRVGRIGGDEFLLLCPDLGGPEQAMNLAERVSAALRGEVTLTSGRVVAYQASVGVAWSDGAGTPPDTLVARADRAMYESKRERAGRPKLAHAASERVPRHA